MNAHQVLVHSILLLEQESFDELLISPLKPELFYFEKDWSINCLICTIVETVHSCTVF